MTLTAHLVRSIADAAVSVFDDHRPSHEALRRTWELPYSGAALQEIRDVLTAHPRLTHEYDYGWTADPAAYRTPMDAYLQALILRLLAGVSGDHPSLADHRPFVARVSVGRDHVSSAVALDRINLIAISHGFTTFLRYFMDFSLDLVDLEERLEPARRHRWRRRPASWGANRISEVFAAFNEEANAALQRFALRSTRLSMDFAEKDDPLRAPDRILRSSVHVYGLNAVQMFAVAHEMTHCLNNHEVPRKLWQEINADWAALSLTLAGIEQPDKGWALLAGASVFSGTPLYLKLGRLFLECSATVDALTGINERMDYEEAFLEMDARWRFFEQTCTEFGLPEAPLLKIRVPVLETVRTASQYLAMVKQNGVMVREARDEIMAQSP